MLKACCDCLAPADLREHHDAYGSGHAGALANGYGHVQSAPPWPRPSRVNETMFLLPKQLAAGDKVVVSGSMIDNPRMIALNLVTGGNSPDYGNIACQVEIRFPASGEDRTTVKIIKDGMEIEKDNPTGSLPAAELFPDSDFTFEFILSMRASGSEPQIEILVAGIFIESLILQHNVSDIRYLTLQGDIARVGKLEFSFDGY